MISQSETSRRQPPLFSQQVWFVRLRWLAGAGVVVGGIVEHLAWKWYGGGAAIAAMGAVLLGYNLALWGLLGVVRKMPAGRARHRRLQGLAWMQILLDLAMLTALTLWTGGLEHSPLLGLYALHMVFAALLLPRSMAFGVAAVAVAMLCGGLAAIGATPRDVHGITRTVGWALALLATVYLASHITRNLQAHRRRLIVQNRRIRGMSARLRRQQQALVQQEKMVAMGQMAAGVAHEVANPLASMDGLLQLLERKPEKVSPENLARLREQISRINTIVRQLTAFAHPDEGDWKIGSLNEVAARSLDVLRFDQRLKAVSMHTELAVDLPPVRLLPAAIEQVVINLVINAVDAMSDVAEPRLVLRTRAETAGEPAAILEVIDNGTGILPENLSRLFEPFFTTKPVGKGTGLGLSISYSLVRKHGGTIDAHNGGVGGGTGATFALRLPVAGASGGSTGASRARETTGSRISKSEKSNL